MRYVRKAVLFCVIMAAGISYLFIVLLVREGYRQDKEE